MSKSTRAPNQTTSTPPVDKKLLKKAQTPAEQDFERRAAQDTIATMVIDQEPRVITKAEYATHDQFLQKYPQLKKILKEHEILLAIDEVPLSPVKPLTAKEALLRLIKKDGYPVAACPMPENEGKGELELFVAKFGRDGLITALILPDEYMYVIETIFTVDAKLQGTRHSPFAEEKPGKILHEFRESTDPIRNILETVDSWQFPYYGNTDSSSLFLKVAKRMVMLAGQKILLAQGYSEGAVTDEMKLGAGKGILEKKIQGKDGDRYTLNDALLGTIQYLLQEISTNPQGLLQYRRSFAGSLPIQSWKDSWNSHMYHNGEIINPRKNRNFIICLEANVYTYDGFLDAADLYRDTNPQLSQQLEVCAHNLKEQILEKFYREDEKGGYFAQALERNETTGELSVLDVRTSNMGHMLNSRLLRGDDPLIVKKRESIIKTLFSKDMLATHGFRTLSNSELLFNPYSYHNGTVWFWDSFWIAQGLEGLGYSELAWDIYNRIEKSVQASGRFPEFASGTDRKKPEFNEMIVRVYNTKYQREDTIMQIAQEIQLWTVASILAIEDKKKFKHTSKEVTYPKVKLSKESAALL